jgi:hypothetical protein
LHFLNFSLCKFWPSGFFGDDFGTLGSVMVELSIWVVGNALEEVSFSRSFLRKPSFMDAAYSSQEIQAPIFVVYIEDFATKLGKRQDIPFAMFLPRLKVVARVL